MAAGGISSRFHSLIAFYVFFANMAEQGFLDKEVVRCVGPLQVGPCAQRALLGPVLPKILQHVKHDLMKSGAALKWTAVLDTVDLAAKLSELL